MRINSNLIITNSNLNTHQQRTFNIFGEKSGEKDDLSETFLRHVSDKSARWNLALYLSPPACHPMRAPPTETAPRAFVNRLCGRSFCKRCLQYIRCECVGLSLASKLLLLVSVSFVVNCFIDFHVTLASCCCV